MRARNFYQILGLKPDASPADIKHAYRRLARKYHPDVSDISNAEEMFKTMGEAYAVLKDPKERAEYDRLLRQSRPKARSKKKAQNSSTVRRRRSTSKVERANEQYAAELNSTFNDSFGRAKRNHGSQGFDVEGKDVYAQVEINKVHTINGGYQQCTIEIPVFTPQGKLTTKQQRLRVRIPKGIKEGETIVIAKRGSPGMGAAAGDFFLEVVFKP